MTLRETWRRFGWSYPHIAAGEFWSPCALRPSRSQSVLLFVFSKEADQATSNNLITYMHWWVVV